MSRVSPLPSLLPLFTLILITLSSLPTPSSSATDSFIYGGCSQIKYPPGSPYESNLNSLLASLANSATFSLYNSFNISGSSPQDLVYGLFQCRGDLSMPDCSRCVSRALSQIGILCYSSTGGALQLQGCFVKYDNSTFLGVEDKTVVLKKCGPSIGYNSDVMSRRDVVLAGLSSGGGPYRVGGSGAVQGMAQCVGDLSASECQDCVSEAVGRLRSECGAAASGDVYLAKCYARFSAGGDHSRDESDEDETGKTLAIIIGLLAAVALIIIFVSFLRKAYEGKAGK